VKGLKRRIGRNRFQGMAISVDQNQSDFRDDIGGRLATGLIEEET
jgi:hypothetical protein